MKKKGQLADAGLSENTKKFLRQVADRGTCSRVEEVPAGTSEASPSQTVAVSGPDQLSESTPTPSQVDGAADHHEDAINVVSTTRWILVPLTADTEFFQQLVSDLSALHCLFERERWYSTIQIMKIGELVAEATSPGNHAAAKDLQRWRSILELYVQAEIFFTGTEEAPVAQSASSAAQRFEWFTNQIDQRQLNRRFKIKESADALNQLMGLHRGLLCSLRFQELNRTALSKILKSMVMASPRSNIES